MVYLFIVKEGANNGLYRANTNINIRGKTYLSDIRQTFTLIILVDKTAICCVKNKNGDTRTVHKNTPLTTFHLQKKKKKYCLYLIIVQPRACPVRMCSD